LTGTLIRTRNLEDYIAALSRLIEDQRFRVRLGIETGKKIKDSHQGSHWQRFLEEVYAQALSLPAAEIASSTADQFHLGEPDVLMPEVHGAACDEQSLLPPLLRMMPFQERLTFWLGSRNDSVFSRTGTLSKLKYLAPEWLISHLR
jgi:hypothetical protein